MFRWWYNCFLVLLALYLVCHGQDEAEIDSADILEARMASTDSYQQRMVNYWTRERLLGAKSIDESNPVPSNNTSDDGITSRTISDGDDTVVDIEGAAGNSTSESRALSAAQQIMKTVGRAFFSVGSSTYSCSASVIVAPSYSLLMTAGRCVYDLQSRRWYTSNWVFVPGYDYGYAPFGIWPAKRLFAPTAFTYSSSSSPNWNYDIGFVVVHPVNNRRIAQVTGSQGLRFNPSRSQPIHSFGYPTNIANGYIMSSCLNKEISPLCVFGSYSGQAIRCGIVQDIGGPRIQNLNVFNGIGYVTSVNSYVCSSTHPYMVHGPYFSSSIQSMYYSVRYQT